MILFSVFAIFNPSYETYFVHYSSCIFPRENNELFEIAYFPKSHRQHSTTWRIKFFDVTRVDHRRRKRTEQIVFRLFNLFFELMTYYQRHHRCLHYTTSICASQLIRIPTTRNYTAFDCGRYNPPIPTRVAYHCWFETVHRFEWWTTDVVVVAVTDVDIRRLEKV